MTLLNTSAESETRTLTTVGSIVVVVIVIATVLYLVANPLGGKPRDTISLAIDTPYVGQGVAAGTPVIMHGVKIGQVVSVSSISGGGVHLETDLEQGTTHGLTDAMGIDYRPSNYFGVTGINVIPAQTGRPLRTGMQINITPKGNFSLQALLYRLGELTNGVFNQRLISVIERGTRYVDGLTPLLETVLIVGNSVAKVQTVSTERLLRNTTGVSVAFPGFIDALTSTGNDFLHTYFVDFDWEKYKKESKYYSVIDDQTRQHFEANFKLYREHEPKDMEFFTKHWSELLDLARTDLFSPVGYLEGSHVNDLTPVLESVRGLADAVPQIVSPDNFAYTLTEVRRRLEHMYQGSGDQRALQVRLILDRLPGVAAPLGLPMGGSS
jgi:phospholipid/cholesterol/gamma-HCH transport system substrate-binding protein